MITVNGRPHVVRVTKVQNVQKCTFGLPCQTTMTAELPSEHKGNVKKVINTKRNVEAIAEMKIIVPYFLVFVYIE